MLYKYSINMNSIKQETFITEFYSFSDPQPNLTQFSEQQLKNNDMKISLQIGSSSCLRMQSDTKTNMISFSCKNYGKSCYQIFARKHNKTYQVITNYKQIKHSKNCELKNQSYQYLKTYNLMKLKKNYIQTFMIENGLLNSSPSQILLQISRKEAYFFQQRILYNSEMRRKLRKRFDNIVNIDIKKITKGGRDIHKNQNYQQNYPRQYNIKQDDQKRRHNITQNDEQYNIRQNQKIDKQKIYRRPKLIKKKSVPLKRLKRDCVVSKLIQCPQISTFQQCTNLPCHQIFLSQPQPILKQIQQLNGQLNQFDDIFSWSIKDDRYRHNYSQTINDKLRDNSYNFVSMISNGQGSIQNLSQLQLFPNFDHQQIQ